MKIDKIKIIFLRSIYKIKLFKQYYIMEKVLKNEFATIFKQMTTEFSRLYPKIFNEEKNKKLNRYLKMNRDSHSFKENAKKIHEQLVKYKQDFDIKNIDILKDIVLFDSLIDFKVFENETEKTKKIILEYIIPILESITKT